jgi:hypothetical protein
MSTSLTPLNRKSVQRPGGPRPTIDTVSERAPLLHTVAALLTAGPVAFGDCVGGSFADHRPGSNRTSDAPML